MKSLIWIAVLLMVVWVVARVVLALTSFALHLFWIAAIILAITWVIGHLSKRT